MNMEAPLCLIEIHENGKFLVNAEALAVLSSISQPAVVVAIAGMYRTGKSYLMNQLAGAQKGFDFSSTFQAQTKGIWMWCLPHPRKENHTLVLLDTEGLGDVEKWDTKMWIFCLAVLLSSAFVYNSKGVIDEDAIGKLHYVEKMSDLIKVKSGNDTNEDKANYSRHFPTFIWAVRDFTLRLEQDGKAITEDEYLKNALKLEKSKITQRSSDTMTKRNSYRDCIRMYFMSRKCFVFDLPTRDKKILQRMDEVSEEQLNPTFIDQMKKFCEYIYEKADVKYMDEIRPVTGKMLGELTTMYTAVINSSNVACMEDMVVNISEKENKAAVKDSTKHYETMMEERVVFPTETLSRFIDLSRQCEDEARDIFLNRSFKDNDHSFFKEYMIKINEIKSEFYQKTEMKSREYCERLIQKYAGDLEKALEDGVYYTPGGYQEFMEYMELIERKYNSEPRRGTQVEEVFLQFQKSKETIANTIIMKDKALTKEQKKLAEYQARRKQDDIKKKMYELKLSMKNEIEKDQQKSIEENKKQMVDKIAGEKRMQQEKLTFVIEQMRKELQDYDSEGLKGQVEMYRRQIKSLEMEENFLKDLGWMTAIVAVCAATFLFGLASPIIAVVGVAAGVVVGVAGGIASLFPRKFW